MPYDEKFNILEMEIQNGEYKPEHKKINAFGALPSPSSFQELGRDLGAFMWLTSYLPFANSTAAPLYALLHSDRWIWTDTHENAFQSMKRLVQSPQVLQPMDLNENTKIWVTTDASLVGVGGWISQGETYENSKSVVYHSRVMTPAQSNYPVHEQELLAVVDMLDTYYHLLAGRKFTLMMDSQPMVSLMSLKRLSPRQS